MLLIKPPRKAAPHGPATVCSEASQPVKQAPHLKLPLHTQGSAHGNLPAQPLGFQKSMFQWLSSNVSIELTSPFLGTHPPPLVPARADLTLCPTPTLQSLQYSRGLFLTPGHSHPRLKPEEKARRKRASPVGLFRGGTAPS